MPDLSKPSSIWLPLVLAAGVFVAKADAAEIARAADSCTAGESADFTLQLLHAADMDGSSGALSHVGAFSALVDHFQNLDCHTLTLSSGDNYIPGPRFFAAGDDDLVDSLGVPDGGRADIALLNAMGFQASAVGNHELDLGTGSFAGLIGAETDDESKQTYPGAAFPYLSSNLDFSADEDLASLVTNDGADAGTLGGKLAGSAVIRVGDQQIGIVGATTPSLSAITSAGGIKVSPADASDTGALAAAIQPTVDTLVESGINKVILLAHMQQITIERELASKLSGVDIIVAGGSNTLLADDNDALREGDSAEGSYPELYTDANGDPVMLVNVDGDYKYLGRLVVGFDSSGVLLTDSVSVAESGVWAATTAMSEEINATPNPTVQAISDAVSEVLKQRDGNILGKTAVYLDGRRSQVRTQETNMGNLTAEANLWLAQQTDKKVQLAIKNGGGIRSDTGRLLQPPGSNDPSQVNFLPPAANPAINKPEGGISQLDLETALRFNNGLTLLTVTAAELIDIVEHAVAATADGASPGQFPQIAGFRFAFDPTLTARDGTDTNGDVTTAGQRVRQLEIIDNNGEVIDTVVADGVLEGDAERTYRLVILDFLAKCVGVEDETCGDGYPLKGLTNADRVDLAQEVDEPVFPVPGTEQDAMAQYLSAYYSATAYDKAETPIEEDERIRNLSANPLP